MNRIHFVGREVEVLGRRLEWSEGFYVPVDDGHDHVTAMEVEATRDGVIGFNPEHHLIEASRRSDLGGGMAMRKTRIMAHFLTRPVTWLLCHTDCPFWCGPRSSSQASP